ncbi:Flagellar biosynthesis protein FlhF [Brevinematales bacterium NS]|nr:hypothetical protein [Brevinematales bacterium]QJR22506.1 Flagellar biosynthesis protein FlhF [Brevinematales bacterium NS]
MEYRNYEGRTRKEAIDRMFAEAIRENRLNETQLLRVTSKEVRRWFGLKKDVVWVAVASIQTKAPRKTVATCRDEMPLFSQASSSPEPVMAAASPKQAKNAVKEQALQVIAEKSATVMKNVSVSSAESELVSKVNKLEMEISSLQNFIKQELSCIREGLVNHHLSEEYEKENEIVRDAEIAKNHLLWIEDFLGERDFDAKVIADILEYLKTLKTEVLIDKNQILLEVKRFLLSHLKSQPISLENYPYGNNILFVGPTGVGKTVTLVKLAAHLAAMRQKKMRFISIDRYKVGADPQLAKYAEILRSPFYEIKTREDFFKLIKQNDGSHFTFIDTAGKSPRDTIPLKELSEWLSQCDVPFDIHLVVSATTKPRDLAFVVENYSCLNFRHVLATKLDETVCYGSLLSMLYRYQLPLSFITNGQEVPQDFEIANIENLVNQALK